MEVQPIAALIHRWNVGGGKVGANHIHRRYAIGEQRLFRSGTNLSLQLFQLGHEFRMERTRLLFAVLARFGRDRVERVCTFQVQMSPAQGIDFAAPQPGMEHEQVKQTALPSKQPARFVITQGPPMKGFLSAHIHLAHDLEWIGGGAVLFA